MSRTEGVDDYADPVRVASPFLLAATRTAEFFRDERAENRDGHGHDELPKVRRSVAGRGDRLPNLRSRVGQVASITAYRRVTTDTCARGTRAGSRHS